MKTKTCRHEQRTKADVPSLHQRRGAELWCAAGALVVIAVACSAPPPKESGYLDRVRQDRVAKDRAFAGDPGCFSGISEGTPCSPVPSERRGRLLPLTYYEPDPSYRVPAALDVVDDHHVFDVPTSTGALLKMRKLGTLEFSLNGEPRTLAAFVELPVQNAERLLVPFRDETTGTETYPAGRYLDLDRTATGIYALDFNSAYHPYCYYDERYDCPLPPPENRLKTAVHAGERLPSRGGSRNEAAAQDGVAAVRGDVDVSKADSSADQLLLAPGDPRPKFE